MTIEIPIKLPSLNQYISACRANRFEAAVMKKDIETKMFPYIYKIERIEKPVIIEFEWVEENRRRDLDNVAFGKKFVLDALVRFGKLPNDNQQYVKGFSDRFSYGDTAGVIVTIKEKDDDTTRIDT